ncbi:fimbria/pilus outer membrane usher protein [Phytopseudomonas dryadis]|uniref:fimbria/pilus outer membrane usher protein n=1 Tax=Phytopseudomonas dryadis TaxID=2487520 RepID=UPI001F607675|nr:fimbria/pilus outer membrane usher protein [Pseudomonas dryadis]
MIIDRRLRPLLALLCLLPDIAQSVSASEPVPLLLAVFINGRDLDQVLAFDEIDGTLFADRAQLLGLGIRLPAEANAQRLDLATLPGWRYSLDPASQTLYLQLPTSDLALQQLNRARARGGGEVMPSASGALLNYDTQATRSSEFDSSNLLASLRLFGAYGVFENSAEQVSGRYFDRRVRLNSTYSYSDPQSMRTFNAGDFINGGLSWTRPVRLAGVQLTTNFDLRPDLITFPRPSLGGEVAVPSSVDVFVNGIRQLSSRVEPGPFEVNQLPVVSGGGDISMLIKDASGRQTSETLPFYTSSQLLRPGLDALSLELGAVRRHYASRSNDYAEGAASLSYRRGLSAQATLESHAEAAPGLAMGGLGGNWLLGDFGVLSGSLAASRHQGRGGGQYGLGFSRNMPWLSVGASILKASDGFTDIAAAVGDSQPGTTLRANLGIPLGRFGSFGMVFAKKRVNLYRFYGSDYRYAEEPPRYIDSAVLSATYSTRLAGSLSAFVTAFRDFENHDSNGFFVGLSLPLGNRRTLSASSNSSGSRTYNRVQAEQTAVQRGDIGWRLASQSGEREQQNAALSYKSDWGRIGVETERADDGNALRATASGAVTLIGGHLFASNRIDDSFALVDTDGAVGVGVNQENRRVGRTDDNGLLFVEDLRAYESNRLSIEPGDVPMNANLAQVEQQVRPADRAGVLVRFAIVQRNGATLRLTDVRGKPLPIGSQVMLLGSDVQVPVGYDGEVFIEGLGPHNEVQVSREGEPDCRARFDYQPDAERIPEIGPLACRQGERR